MYLDGQYLESCKADPLQGVKSLLLTGQRWIPSLWKLQFCDESLRLTYSCWLPGGRTIRIFRYLWHRCENFGNFITKGNGRCCSIRTAYGTRIVLSLCTTRLLQVDNVIQMAWIPTYFYEVLCCMSGNEMITPCSSPDGLVLNLWQWKQAPIGR